MSEKEKIISRIKQNMGEIKKFGVKRIGIFGSCARDEIEKDSDIDIVVEFERGKATFKNVAGLIDFLEELLEREIDLLTPEGIENIRLKSVKERILKEIEYV